MAEPQNGREAAFLRCFRRLPPREQRAFRDGLIRAAEGQSFEAAMVEALGELGVPPAEARRRVAGALRGGRDWRKGLD